MASLVLSLRIAPSTPPLGLGGGRFRGRRGAVACRAATFQQLDAVGESPYHMWGGMSWFADWWFDLKCVFSWAQR